MNLIRTFGMRIKPILTRGKGMLNPLDNQILFERIVCIRDRDVNCFLIKSRNGCIAIDSGYMNSENTARGLKLLGVDPLTVSDVFLTHLDIDHAGGVASKADRLYKNATIHISRSEQKYLSEEYVRKVFLGHKCKFPLALDDYSTFPDECEIKVDGVLIKAIPTPGHTLGHTAYQIDNKYLFTGDCIIANEDGGFLFYDFWNQDPALNRKSVERLRFSISKSVEYVFTSHSGYLTVDYAFKHTDSSPNWRKKGFVFCRSAPKDPFAAN